MFLCLAVASISRSVSLSRNEVLVIPSNVPCGEWYIPVTVHMVDCGCTIHVRGLKLIYWFWFVFCVMFPTVGWSVVISAIPPPDF